MRKIVFILLGLSLFLFLACEQENLDGFVPPKPTNISFSPSTVNIGDELTITFNWAYWYGIERFYNLSAGEDGLLVYSNTAEVTEARDEAWRDCDWNETSYIRLGKQLIQKTIYDDKYEFYTEITKFIEWNITEDDNCTIKFIVPEDAVSGNIILFPDGSFDCISTDKLIVQDADGNVIEAQE